MVFWHRGSYHSDYGDVSGYGKEVQVYLKVEAVIEVNIDGV